MCYFFIHISTFLALVELSFISDTNTFDLKKSRMLFDSRNLTYPTKTDHAPQSSRYWLLEVLFPEDLHTHQDEPQFLKTTKILPTLFFVVVNKKRMF